MKPRPAVSIVIPAYNTEKYIERCINSCLFQKTSLEYEVVVTDDSSSDATQEILEDVYSREELLNIRHNQDNIGVGLTRNECIKRAKGRYVFLLDSDDYIHPFTIDLMYRSLQLLPHVPVSYCDYIYVDDHEQKSRPISAKERPIACGMMISKFLFTQYGLYSDMSIGEERDFHSRLVGNNVDMLHLPLPLYRYRQHDLSITSEFETKRSYDCQ